MHHEIRAIQSYEIPMLAAFAAENFALNFGHLYEPDHLKAHNEKTCSTSFFERELAAGAEIFGVFEGSVLIAYIKIGAVGLPVECEPSDREIHRCYIAKSHQNQGLGRQLFEYALNVPQIHAATHVYLGVWEENFIAQKLYKSLGFMEVGRYLYEVGPHRDREIIMRKSQTSD